MTDWTEAGRKADAHRIRDLYRRVFDSPAKQAVRRRVSEGLRAVGGRTVLDLWGGGLSAAHFTREGFGVVSVDNGSLVLSDKETVISMARKRRAIEYTAKEDGYSARWGMATKYAQEADVAFLDFCGPWTKDVRRTVAACRHMRAVIVTLMPDHDMSSDATTRQERLAAYEAFLVLAFSGRSAQSGRGVYRRRLCTYARDHGQRVFVLMVSHVPISMPRIASRDISKIKRTYMTKDQRDKERARYRKLYSLRKDELNMRAIEQRRIRRATDPVYVARLRHSYHVKVSRFYSYCELCQQTGQNLPPGLLHKRMLTE